VAVQQGSMYTVQMDSAVMDFACTYPREHPIGYRPQSQSKQLDVQGLARDVEPSTRPICIEPMLPVPKLHITPRAPPSRTFAIPADPTKLIPGGSIVRTLCIHRVDVVVVWGKHETNNDGGELSFIVLVEHTQWVMDCCVREALTR
jgi:hypothetical protein